MSEKTLAQQLVVHFPEFMQAEGEVRVLGTDESVPIERGRFFSIGLGEKVRIGDSTVKVTGQATSGDIHIDLYSDSQARAIDMVNRKGEETQ